MKHILFLLLQPKNKEGEQEDSSPQYEVLKTIKGKDLVGLQYKPLFDYFADWGDRAFTVVADSYVTNDSGTGIVHQVRKEKKTMSFHWNGNAIG